MNKKQIQEERTRGFFVEATKNILRSEGVKGISVRSIADAAGYSFATLYNYFRDVRELIFICVGDFRQEASEWITQKTIVAEPGLPRIEALAMAYADYFVEYPGIFQLFFIEKLNEISNSQQTAGLVYNFLSDLCTTDCEVATASGQLGNEELKDRIELINNLVAGALLFYLNRISPPSYTDFRTSLQKQVAMIVQGKG